MKTVFDFPLTGLENNLTALKERKEKLGLKMSVQALQICAQYSNAKGKDPFSLSELQLLDDFAALPAKGSSVTLSELYTNDSFAALTYADMINKRRELHPEATTPISFGEAFGMASAYLMRAGKQPNLPKCSTQLTQLSSPAQKSPKNAVGISGSGFVLEPRLSQKAIAITPTDLFVLLHRGDTPMWRYPNAVHTLTEAPAVAEQIKRQFPVLPEGLLSTLLPICSGVWYDLRRLSPESTATAPRLLVNHFADYIVLVIPKDASELVVQEAKACGLRPLVFAAAIPEQHILLTTASGKATKIELSLLRALVQKPRLQVRLPDESGSETDAVFTLPSVAHACAYLQSDGKLSNERIAHRGCVVSASHCKLQKSFFRSAVETIVSVVLNVTLAGGQLEDIRLALAMDLPQSTDGLSETMSALLGIYRTEAELGIPAAALAMQDHADLQHPALTAFAIGNAGTLPSRFRTAGNNLYCVSIKRAENHLPDFPALRHLLGELSSWVAAGKIYSAHLLTNQSLTDGLSEMSLPQLGYQLTEPNVILEPQSNLTLLLESPETLPLFCIGKVKELPATKPLPLRKLPTQGTVWSDRYEVVLLANSTDADARSLSDYLSQNSIGCRCFDETSEEGPLSRAVLNATLLIIGKEIALPAGPHMDFALQVQAAAGGAVLCLGAPPQLPEEIRVIECPDGICESEWMQIFQETL